MTQAGNSKSVFVDEADIDTIEMEPPQGLRALQPSTDSTDQFELISRYLPKPDDTSTVPSPLPPAPAEPADSNGTLAIASHDVPDNSRWARVSLFGAAAVAAVLVWLWNIGSSQTRESSPLTVTSASALPATPESAAMATSASRSAAAPELMPTSSDTAAPETASASTLPAHAEREPLSTPISSSAVGLQERPRGEAVKFSNPFDATEVFEFPAGTSAIEARQAVTELLLRRARERERQWRGM